MAVSGKYRANLHILPLPIINETWAHLVAMRVENEDLDYRAMITEVIDAYMAEIMDRAEVDHRRWTIMTQTFPYKAEPAAGTSSWGHLTRTYHGDCLHCGENIHQALAKGNRLVWVHNATNAERCDGSY